MQMVANPAKTHARPKRPAGWTFKRLDTIRHQILQRAGRFQFIPDNFEQGLFLSVVQMIADIGLLDAFVEEINGRVYGDRLLF
jgi:hypothetical protein